MLFGQSVFQSVLTRLEEEKQDDDANALAADFRIRGLSAGFVASTEGASTTASAQAAAYLADLPEEPENPPEPTQQPVLPVHLGRITPAEIAEDLAITAADTVESLNEKRRGFAKHNHPDRVAPQWRDNATIRMQTANLLIDRAIKDLSWR